MTARTFALVIGIVFLALGVLGFIPSLVTPAPEQAPDVSFTAYYGYLFGFLAVNYFVNLAHMAMGAWGVAASRGEGGSRAYAKTIAVVAGLLAVAGLVPQISTLFGFVPVFGLDVWVHGIAAVAAAFIGWLLPRRSIFAERDVAMRSR